MPVNSNTYIYRMGTAPNTRAAVSQKNKVYGYSLGGEAGFKQLGAISEFGFDESRTVDPVRGVGFGDMIAELVPSVTDPMSLTLNKTLLYTANLFQMVGYKGGVDGLVRSLRHHRWPFDIKQELVFSEIVNAETGDNSQRRVGDVGPATTGLVSTNIQALFTYYEGCWFQGYNASFTSDAAIVTENGTVLCTDIIDGTSKYGEYIDSGLAPIASGQAAAGKGFSLRFAGGANTPIVPLP